MPRCRSGAAVESKLMSRGRPRPPAGDYGRALAAIWLGLIAGFVDALGYLLLTQVYTSHMTGNTASLARDVADHRWFGVLRHGWPIAAFMAGLLQTQLAGQAQQSLGTGYQSGLDFLNTGYGAGKHRPGVAAPVRW